VLVRTLWIGIFDFVQPYGFGQSLQELQQVRQDFVLVLQLWFQKVNAQSDDGILAPLVYPESALLGLLGAELVQFLDLDRAETINW
jgi:hypothetical protein